MYKYDFVQVPAKRLNGTKEHGESYVLRVEMDGVSLQQSLRI